MSALARLVALSDERARDSDLVGVKAAGLARAAALGFPVLDGWVLPCGEAAAALQSGEETLDRAGRAAAYLTISQTKLEPALVGDLEEVGRALGSSAIVRSSTALDADRRWSGAFATYQDTASSDLPTAVRGCWASAASRDVLERTEALGAGKGLPPVSVLIQPWLHLEAGGTARADPDGPVAVAATIGSPDPHVTAEATSLALKVAEVTGGDAIEWGWAEGRIVLLQTRRSEGPPPAARPPRPRRVAMPLETERITRLVTHYPSPLGDHLVIPWALGLSQLPEAEPVHGISPAAALHEARQLAGQLTAQAWGRPSDRASRDAAEVIRLLLGPEPAAGVARVAEAGRVDPALAARVLGLLDGVAQALTVAGLLPRADAMWRLSPAELDRAVGDDLRPPVRRGPDRWAPFVFSTVASRGLLHQGESAAEGIGAGALFSAATVRAGGAPIPRTVLIAPDPDPHLAPLLWHSAAIVTATGSRGAHLFEVAGSLGIPAIVGVDLSAAAQSGAMVAVDGYDGTVMVLPFEAAR